MKKQLMTAVVIVGVTCLSSANADVVTGTNVKLDAALYWGLGQHSLTTCHNEQCDNGTTMWFNKVNKYGQYSGLGGVLSYGNYSTLTPTTWNIDEEADYYLVPYGAEFSASTIGSGQFKPLFVFDNATPIDVPFGTFYLGVNTGNNGPGWPPREDFGWALLSNSSTGLTMVSNAMAYDSNGIFVGTTNIVPVPEPETYAMLMVGLGLVGWAARRRKQAEI